MSPPRLEAQGITKRFSGIAAVDAASLSLAKGEIHALVGENGSGKSTLCMVIAGVYRPDGGVLRIDGLDVAPDDPRAAQTLGISMMYQESNLVPELTVAENIALGHEPFFLNRRATESRVREVIGRLGFKLDPGQKAGQLSGAQMQMVEIAKALYAQSKVIIMDEPTAALSAAETDTLHAVVREIAADGVSVIYISHALEEALSLAQRVTVLRDGQVVACRNSSDLTREELVSLMVGRQLGVVERGEAIAAPGLELLRVERLSWSGKVRNVSFVLRAGEVVGMAGLVGSGRSELASLLGGLERPDEGRILLRGQTISIRSPRAARRSGIALLTENRKEEGLFQQLSVAKNLTVTVWQRLAGVLGILTERREKMEARRLADAFAVVASSLSAEVRTLSGGNQQKALIGRMMNWNPEILIFDEPTKGVDVGAIAEIHRLIRDAAAAGKAVLMISSYLPEIMAVSDRVLVMRQGSIAADVEAGQATSAAIISNAFR